MMTVHYLTCVIQHCQLIAASNGGRGKKQRMTRNMKRQFFEWQKDNGAFDGDRFEKWSVHLENRSDCVCKGIGNGQWFVSSCLILMVAPQLACIGPIR